MTRTASTTEEKMRRKVSFLMSNYRSQVSNSYCQHHIGEDQWQWLIWCIKIFEEKVGNNKFIFYSRTAELQAAKGGSRANATGKASSSGELKFCGENG